MPRLIDTSIRILGQSTWNIFELRSLLGIVSNDLMSSCTSEATGLDVVLSGFFSSTRIFPNHTIDPEHRRRAEEALRELGIAHLGEQVLHKQDVQRPNPHVILSVDGLDSAVWAGRVK